VDFQRLAAGQKIRVKVPVVLLGEDVSPGIKAGGVANLVRRDLEVLADPDSVPERFEIDVSEASIGDTLRWSAVKGTEGTTATIARDFVVLTIAPPVVVEEAPVVAAPAPAADAKGGKGGKAAPAKKK
jgi:large subunit ribosomal protein L25